MSTAFPLSTRYRDWVSRLRVKSIKGPLLSGIAQALGDQTVDDLTQAIIEHWPEYANDPKSNGLTGSERLIDRGPTESDADWAHRITYAVPLSKLHGTPFGVLVALYYAGFAGAVWVQQNGIGYNLSAPPNLDDIAAAPANGAPSWLVKTQLDQLIAVNTPETRAPVGATKTIPVGQSWWQLDNAFNTDFCSRFQILFPGPVLPSWFVTAGRATFTNANSAVATFNNAFPSTSYNVDPSPPTITGGGPISVWADASTKTTTGITVFASDLFTGYVDVLAWQVGANPYADLHPSDLARLRAVIAKWKPAKATCLSINALVQGRFWGWPVATWSQNTTWQPSTVVKISP